MKHPNFLFFCSALFCSCLFAHPASAQDDSVVQNRDTREMVSGFMKQQAAVHYIYQASLDAHGTRICWSTDVTPGLQRIFSAPVRQPGQKTMITAMKDSSSGNETEPVWSPDGKRIAFLSEAGSPGQMQIFIADAADGKIIAGPLGQFNGYISHLKWSPRAKYLSVLYVHKASRDPSPMAAENRAVGLIDSSLNDNVERVAVLNAAGGGVRETSPEGLYVFEYDWSPDESQLAYTAAVPPGDDNWYIAGLYRQPLDGDTVKLYQPQFQIAVPRWSPDATRIAFIEGLMSDQGGNGGEIFVVPAGSGKPSSAVSVTPRNLTPGRSATPSWFTWRPDGSILFSEFRGGSVAMNALDPKTSTTRLLWKADETMRAGNDETSFSVAGTATDPQFAYIRASWTELPEVVTGTIKRRIPFTSMNTGNPAPTVKAENITWISDNQPVQGWLLYPEPYDPAKKYPMLVCVHGGPAWISTPAWSAPDFNTTLYPRMGYFVFFPNPRGSYGQGETFTRANRRDWGFGDLRDILHGVDTILRKLPVDSTRLGMLGWSYGGSMSMFAVTQTNRFAASVAGAGSGDWLSYYGQNRIDKWMKCYFKVSPYDDPAPYAKVSAMTYIKNVHTPVLLLVGERDGESPSPQSFQYWHALKELRVPTSLMVYADEGHSFEQFENMIDVSVRSIEWFNRFLKPGASKKTAP